jgi:uncharacterized protein (TIGR03435 family)
MYMRTASVGGVLLVFACYAQQSAHPEFEVAAVKPAIDPRQPGSGEHRLGPRISGNRADYCYMTLRQLVAEAWQVKTFQIDGPDWLSIERFDVLAKMPPGSRKEEAPLMLQALLAERFKLAVHREFREESVSALVVARGGPKLTESPSPGEAKPPEKARQAGASASATMGTVAVRTTLDSANSSVRFEASRARMADLAGFLVRFGVSGGRPIVDMTGLKGEYEIVLDIPVALPPPPGETPADEASDPRAGRIMRSLKSLGLELKNTKAPVEYLVVDHAEKKPTEN